MIAVLLTDHASDRHVLEKGVVAAQERRDRLAVLIVPTFSRLLAHCALIGGTPIPGWKSAEEQAAEAIERCRVLALAIVPGDVPMMIRAVSTGRARQAARILEELGPTVVLGADTPRVNCMVRASRSLESGSERTVDTGHPGLLFRAATYASPQEQ